MMVWRKYFFHISYLDYGGQIVSIVQQRIEEKNCRHWIFIVNYVILQGLAILNANFNVNMDNFGIYYLFQPNLCTLHTNALQ